jgi:hypothetical protein
MKSIWKMFKGKSTVNRMLKQLNLTHKQNYSIKNNKHLQLENKWMMMMKVKMIKKFLDCIILRIFQI